MMALPEIPLKLLTARTFFALAVLVVFASSTAAAVASLPAPHGSKWALALGAARGSARSAFGNPDGSVRDGMGLTRAAGGLTGWVAGSRLGLNEEFREQSRGRFADVVIVTGESGFGAGVFH